MDQLQLHNKIGLVGLRAEATASGFLQLCEELRRAGVLTDDAVIRIKDAIARDIALSKPMSMSHDDFDRWVHDQLDGLLAAAGQRVSTRTDG